MTADEKTGTLFMPVAGPSANYDGSDRPGDNLYGNSIVAVDVRDRQAEVALPDRPPRHLGHRPAGPALAGRHQGRRQDHPGARLHRQDGLHVHPRPQHRQAGVRGRRDPRHPRRRPRRAVLADPADPGQTRRPGPQVVDRRRRGHRRADTNELHVAACKTLLQEYGGSFFNSGPFTPFFLQKEGAPVEASINLPMNGGALLGRQRRGPREPACCSSTSPRAAASATWRSGGRQELRPRHRGLRARPSTAPAWPRPGAYTSFSASYQDAGRQARLHAVPAPAVGPD